jgi:hypothetical protein
MLHKCRVPGTLLTKDASDYTTSYRVAAEGVFVPGIVVIESSTPSESKLQTQYYSNPSTVYSTYCMFACPLDSKQGYVVARCV